MNKFTVLLGILLCIATASARHHTDRSEVDSSEDKEDLDSGGREHDASQIRHRRRRIRQTNHRYNYYQQPPSDYDTGYRRAYDQIQQDYMPQILRLLDDISFYIRRPQQLAPPPPPSPPQPIYIPYPISYPVPQRCRCPVQMNPNVTNRGTFMDDPNQNWGMYDPNIYDYEDGDGSRPIQLDKIPQRRPQRPPPKVDHGTTQGGNPNGADSKPKLPGPCDVFSLSCCGGTEEQRRICFKNYGCSQIYNNGNACHPTKIQNIIEAYTKAYALVNLN